LNQFGAHYAVLHDSDKPTFTNSKGEVKNNPAWTLNSRILETINNAPLSSKVRLMASVPNFEKAFFGKEATDEKPYSALQILRAAPKALGTIESLLQALLGEDGTVPPQGALEWHDITKLEAAVMSG
jgi:putative ATP-dependent endonuclease of the OLD family